MHLSKRSSCRGFTLIDCIGATLIVAVALAGIFYTNGRALTMLRALKMTAISSKSLQQRLEQARTANWTEVTDAAFLQDLYSTPTDSAGELNGETDRITVSQWPVAATPLPNLQVTRNADGTVTINSDSPAIVDGTAVRVDVRISWPGGVGGATRMRESSMIIANGGVGR